MDPRLLKYYDRELRFIREMGGEFAREFPKIAGRLGLDGFECADPYVERLLEGFAFLAARVQLKIDMEFPKFTQHLLEMVYPHYLAPTPSMAVVQLQPDLSEGDLVNGFVVPRGTVLRSILGKGDRTPCEYRTAHELTLWPLQLTHAEYFAGTTAVRDLEPARLQGVKAGIRLHLGTTAGATFDKLALDSLPLYLRGGERLPVPLYEQLLGNAVAVVVRPLRRPASWYRIFPKSHIRRVGFAEDQALLPYGPQSFQGYRLLHEYFAFPDRYMFVELAGLGEAIRHCTDTELEIVVLLNRYDPGLENALSAVDLALFCTPAINLFPRRADRIHLSERATEHHVIPDRTRPMDFEVYQVTRVTGFGAGNELEQEFLPFYTAHDLTSHRPDRAYYTVHRLPRLLSAQQRRRGPRSGSYIGSEAFISLVDAGEAPYGGELKQLAVETLCTNRDLPLHMPVGAGATDFTLEIGAPVAAVRCLDGPTRPRPSHAEGETAWRLINHLSLNYLSLLDSNAEQGAAALRELLMLYGKAGEAAAAKQIEEGLKSVTTQPVTRRLPIAGPIAFGRGLKITVSLEETAFEGGGAFLLGAVLEAFFARYVSINAFTETVIRTLERGEIMQWPARIGRRHLL